MIVSPPLPASIVNDTSGVLKVKLLVKVLPSLVKLSPSKVTFIRLSVVSGASSRMKSSSNTEPLIRRSSALPATTSVGSMPL